VQQQFARAGGVVVCNVSMRIRADMYVEQKRFAILDEAVGVFEVGLTLADGFDLGAAESDAGFEFFEEEVVMAGHAIVRGIPLTGSHGIAGLDGLLGAGGGRLDDYVTGLTRHIRANSSLYPSIGLGIGVVIRNYGTAQPETAGLC